MTSQPTFVPQPAATTQPIRIGVVLARDPQPKWVRSVLDEINRSEFAKLAMIIRSDKGSSAPLAVTLVSAPSTLLFRIWRKWDDWYFETKDRLPAADISSTEGKTTIHVSNGIDAQQISRVQAANLDVILQLGDVVVQTELASAARYGVWHYAGSRDEERRLAHIMSKGEQTFVTSLHATWSSGRQVLDEAVAHLRQESLCRNQQAAAVIKVQILMRRLKLLHQYGPASLPQSPGQVSPGVARSNTVISAPRFLTRWAASALQRTIKNRLVLEQWFIAFRNRRGAVPSDMTGFQVITPPSDRFYADPFVISRNQHSYIFFEDYRFALRKGAISCVEVDQSGSYSEPVPVIENSYHMSYPQLFTWQGETYLIPETCEAKRIEVYRAAEFPYRWKREKVLMDDVLAVDATLMEYGGRVWLFASGMSARPWAPNEELFLFSSDSLFGPWHPHPKNPIVCDVRRARPAGQLSYSDGVLIRPNQDCSKTYGYAVVLNRVELLSESEYREVPIATITPDWQPGNLGTHTFNQNELFQVIDGRILIRRRSSVRATQRPGAAEDHTRVSL